MMTEEIRDLHFWIALVISLATVGVFVYWLRTGARRRD